MRQAHEPTIGFSVWPVLLTIEGPTNMVGMVLAMMYDDHRIPNGEWHVDHSFKSRAEFAEHLKAGGKEKRRLGVGAKTAIVASMIQARAESFGLRCVIFRSETKPVRPVKPL
jgi:hypothetical protein